MSDSYDHVDYSLPGFSVHEIFQERTPEWVAIAFSKGSSQPRDGTHKVLSCLHWQVILYQLCHLGSTEMTDI